MQNFNFFLFQRHFYNVAFILTTENLKTLQTKFFFDKLNFKLLKQMSLSSALFFKVKIKLMTFYINNLIKYDFVNNLQQNKQIFNCKKNSNIFILTTQIRNKRLNSFITKQKQKHNFLFLFQFLKKLKKHKLHFKNLLTKKNVQLYKNYSAGFFLSDFAENRLGKVKKNKVFTIREQIYELIKDNQRKKNRVAKAMLIANNVKFLKKKNWRLPNFVAGYIFSKFKKKASNYIYWFNRVFFNTYLKPIRMFSSKIQEEFQFVRDFPFILKKRKKSIGLKQFPWKLFYLKSKILLQKPESSIFNNAVVSGNKPKLFLKVSKKFNKINLKFLNTNNSDNDNLLLNCFYNNCFVFNFAQLANFNFLSFTYNYVNNNVNIKNLFNCNFFQKLKVARKKAKHLKLYLVLMKKKKNFTKKLSINNCEKTTSVKLLKSLIYFFKIKNKNLQKFKVFNSSTKSVLKKLNKKMFFLFKRAKVFVKRYYKRFFDFYPNEMYSFVDKNLGKFQLSLNQKTEFLNTSLKPLFFDSFQKSVLLFQKTQIFDDVFLSFFFSSYNFFDTLRFNVVHKLNVVLLQQTFAMLDLLKKKRSNRTLKTRLQYSYFKIQQQCSVPGKISFTLNSNSIFLTVSDSSGLTLLQTSTGSVSKILKVTNLRKEAKPGCGFKRRKLARQIKIRRMIKDFSKGKTKKLKKKFIAQMSRRQKGKRKLKTQNKTKYISQDFVKPLFFLLEMFLFRVRNFKSRKQLLKQEKLKIKLKAKLFKLKKVNKTKTKTYKDIKKKIDEIEKFFISKVYRKKVTLKQENIIKLLFPLDKDSVKKKKNTNFLSTLVEKLRFNKKLKKNRVLSLTLKKKIVKIFAHKNIDFFLTLGKKKKNFENYFSNIYLKNLKKKYYLLQQNKQNFFDFILFNKKREKQKLKLFFENFKKIIYKQTFFSSYVLCLKNFSIATIRRVFLYNLKTLLRKIKILKKNLEKKINSYVNFLYLKKLNNAI